MVFLQYEQEYVFEFLQASSLFLDKLDKPIAYVQLLLDSEIVKKYTIEKMWHSEYSHAKAASGRLSFKRGYNQRCQWY